MENTVRSTTSGPVFESALLTDISELVSRLESHAFQATHASRLENDLGFSANKVLYVLGSRGSSRPSVLATQLATGRANVSKVVRLLEEQGLVVRTRDPQDSRAFLLALTPVGEQRAEGVFRIGDRMLQEVMADWSPTEVAVFTDLMARFNRGIAAYERGLSAVLQADGAPARAMKDVTH